VLLVANRKHHSTFSRIRQSGLRTDIVAACFVIDQPTSARRTRLAAMEAPVRPLTAFEGMEAVA
jgi:hypothetical protein